uniref:Uncharacterized protein n=1 Tax=Bracon brevicornis TaxID=1563983 RepID=A0A6V7IUW6_9HYME
MEAFCMIAFAVLLERRNVPYRSKDFQRSKSYSREVRASDLTAQQDQQQQVNHQHPINSDVSLAVGLFSSRDSRKIVENKLNLIIILNNIEQESTSIEGEL